MGKIITSPALSKVSILNLNENKILKYLSPPPTVLSIDNKIKDFKDFGPFDGSQDSETNYMRQY